VQWEANLIRNELLADHQASLNRFLPVVLPGCSADDIPAWLGPASHTHYAVSEYTLTGAGKLLRLLTGQPYEPMPPVGPVPKTTAPRCFLEGGKAEASASPVG
jgi:hypothetical protein